jgi:hypothetical protein
MTQRHGFFKHVIERSVIEARCFIVDAVVSAGTVPLSGKLLDPEMLVLTPRGRERTKAEFSKLLRGSGFRLSRVVATEGPLSISKPSSRDARTEVQ